MKGEGKEVGCSGSGTQSCLDEDGHRFTYTVYSIQCAHTCTDIYYPACSPQKYLYEYIGTYRVAAVETPCLSFLYFADT